MCHHRGKSIRAEQKMSQGVSSASAARRNGETMYRSPTTGKFSAQVVSLILKLTQAGKTSHISANKQMGVHSKWQGIRSCFQSHRVIYDWNSCSYLLKLSKEKYVSLSKNKNPLSQSLITTLPSAVFPLVFCFLFCE